MRVTAAIFTAFAMLAAEANSAHLGPKNEHAAASPTSELIETKSEAEAQALTESMVFTESLLDAYTDTCEPCSRDMKACQVDVSKVDHLFHLLAQLDGAPSVEELYAQVERD